jgi:hypothetical protein
MAERFVVGMLLMHHGSPRDRRALAELAAALPGAEIGEPDEIGVFEIVLDAEDREDSLAQVWNAVAASGCDDHIQFVEHPDLPEHWRRVSASPEA